MSGMVSWVLRWSGAPAVRICSLLALLVASGCNSPYREALKRAENALQQGDLMMAAQAYKQACDAARDEKQTCETARRLAGEAADEVVVTVRPACEAGQLDECLPLLVKARELAPNHPGVIALLEQSSTLHIERCAARKTQGAENEAVAELACLQALREPFSVPGYQSHLKKTEAQLAVRFSELARGAEEQGAVGAASVLWSTAHCLAPDDAFARRSLRFREEFLDWSHVPVTLYLGGAIPTSFAPELANPCPSMAAQMPAWVRCVEPIVNEPSQREKLNVQVDANIQELPKDVLLEMRSVGYVRKETKDNPAYATAKERLDKAEAALQAVGQQKSLIANVRCGALAALQEKACANCPKPAKGNGCGDVQKLSEDYERLTRERDTAKKAFDETPKQAEVAVQMLIPYAVRTHNWGYDFRFRIWTNSGGLSTLSHQGTLNFEDKEHDGFVLAKLEPDLLKPPHPKEVAKAFLEQLRPHVVTAVRQDGALRAARRRAQCERYPAQWSTDWMQCWTEAALWESGQVPSATRLLETLAATTGAYRSVQCR